MGRAVFVRAAEVQVRLTGLTALAALRRELRIPIRAIQSVSTQPVDRSGIRVRGTSIPFTDYRQGEYRRGQRRFFFSFERRASTITLDVSRRHWHEPFDVVVLGVDDPEEVARAVSERQ
jgi:hypothetical protein